MERYVRATRLRDGLLLFAALAMVVGIRGVYHLIWFLILAALLLWVTRGRWRTGLAAVAVPSLLIGAFYVRNFVVFGDVLPGELYRKINYAQMIQQQAPPDVLARLEREGRISGILEVDATLGNRDPAVRWNGCSYPRIKRNSLFQEGHDSKWPDVRTLGP
ncbi:MAG: hypothetical protein WBL61_26055 [Bryobacteraceae bacterium]